MVRMLRPVIKKGKSTDQAVGWFGEEKINKSWVRLRENCE
jgi:hypothetical protein